MAMKKVSKLTTVLAGLLLTGCTRVGQESPKINQVEGFATDAYLVEYLKVDGKRCIYFERYTGHYKIGSLDCDWSTDDQTSQGKVSK